MALDVFREITMSCVNRALGGRVDEWDRAKGKCRDYSMAQIESSRLVIDIHGREDRVFCWVPPRPRVLASFRWI